MQSRAAIYLLSTSFHHKLSDLCWMRSLIRRIQVYFHFGFNCFGQFSGHDTNVWWSFGCDWMNELFARPIANPPRIYNWDEWAQAPALNANERKIPFLCPENCICKQFNRIDKHLNVCTQTHKRAGRPNQVGTQLYLLRQLFSILWLRIRMPSKCTHTSRVTHMDSLVNIVGVVVVVEQFYIFRMNGWQHLRATCTGSPFVCVCAGGCVLSMRVKTFSIRANREKGYGIVDACTRISLSFGFAH